MIRLSGSAIRAVHRRDSAAVESGLAEAASVLAAAHAALRPHPAVAFAGFLHDAEKEYAEARLTEALVAGRVPLPDASILGIGVAAWLNGFAEAASELRREVLDQLRADDLDEAQRLFAAMEAAYDLLVGFDFPDALTGGLRRTTDALRAVLERTRADLTLTVVQSRLLRDRGEVVPD